MQTGPEGPAACDSVTCDQPRSAFARFFGAGEADATFVLDELSIGAAVEGEGEDEAMLLDVVLAVLPTVAGCAVGAAPIVVTAAELPQFVVALTCAPPAWCERWRSAIVLQSLDRRLVSVVVLVDGGGVTPSLLPVEGSPVCTWANAPAIAKAAAEATRPLVRMDFIQDSLSSLLWVTGAFGR
jgi:hypothetical protein